MISVALEFERTSNQLLEYRYHECLMVLIVTIRNIPSDDKKPSTQSNYIYSSEKQDNYSR